jgi:Na+/H+ antiporter NhaD/arsenite permease-like protein
MPEPIIVPWWGAVPFALLLACIATFPLMPGTSRLWHHKRFQLAVALVFGVPMAVWMWLAGHHSGVIHALVEYAQFITLLLTLFVVSGGICVAGDIPATPRNNVAMLAIGAALASFIGTTGAAMLMIRPLLNVNTQREHKVHTVVFAIFVVANCGGLLTPLGDPPLFLGLLRGVPFLWTMKLLPEWAFVNGLLLATFYALDRRMYARESAAAIRRDQTEIVPIGIRGKVNFLWLCCIIAAVALVPSVDLHAIHEGHAPWLAWVPLRELLMLSAAASSLLFGDKSVRMEQNKFTWSPILEVAALFIGIFLSMVPALRYLAQVAPLLPLNAVTFFAFSGGLSSVLDNAPTYATFFEMALKLGGTPAVAGVRELYLVSISLGAVLCGAITYIGNGPNFMVKSIADSAGVRMPTFGGYMVLWALRYLVPILVLLVLVFIVQDWRVRLLGAVLAAAWLGYHLWQGWRIGDPHASKVPAASAAAGPS